MKIAIYGNVMQYQVDVSNVILDAESMIDSFKAVKQATCSLNGGVGFLQSAADDIDRRIQNEEDKKNSAIGIKSKSEEFLRLVQRIDENVAQIVKTNKEEFYSVNPWLKPSISVEEEEPWYEKTWNWLCDKGNEVVNSVKQTWNWIEDTVKKAWNGLVDFYEEHKKIIDTVLIVVGAVATIVAVVATGGVALVPLLGALGVSTTVATTISIAVAVVAVVSTVVSSTTNIIDVWCEIDDSKFQTFKKTVNVISMVSNITYSIGNIYNSIKGITPQQYIANNPVETPTYTSVKQLSKNQINALTDYSGEDFRNINNSLRGMETVTPENAQRINTLKQTLDNSSLPQDMTLYRGTTTNALGDLKNWESEDLVGKTFVENGFMSTSTSSSVGNAFKYDMQITINAARGSHAMDISSISNYANEAEVLFSAGQEMIITGVEKINGILHITVSIL